MLPEDRRCGLRYTIGDEHHRGHRTVDAVEYPQSFEAKTGVTLGGHQMRLRLRGPRWQVAERCHDLRFHVGSPLRPCVFIGGNVERRERQCLVNLRYERVLFGFGFAVRRHRIGAARGGFQHRRRKDRELAFNAIRDGIRQTFVPLRREVRAVFAQQFRGVAIVYDAVQIVNRYAERQ